MTNQSADEKLSITDAEESDLDWILNLEETAEKGGFVSGDNVMRHRLQMSDRTCLYLIAKRGDEPIGYVLLRGISGSEPVIELKRIVIGQTDAGHGQGVMGLALVKCFQELNAHRVWLDVIFDNDRAIHVYKKIGFKEEGRLREAALRKGEWCDLMIFGLLKSEFGKK
ncbi:MAG: GNAT family protein [Hyphomonadaceae bacterium]